MYVRAADRSTVTAHRFLAEHLRRTPPPLLLSLLAAAAAHDAGARTETSSVPR